MSKYTPGPWKFDWEDEDRKWAIVTSPTGKIVANVNTESWSDCMSLVSDKMPAEANAFLIASAPDLLEFAKSFVDLYKESDMRPEDECSGLFGAALSAIAKAEGEE